MLKQTFVDIETAKALRKCNFRELTYAFYDLEGNLQNADANDPSLKDWNAPKETRGTAKRNNLRGKMLELREINR